MKCGWVRREDLRDPVRGWGYVPGSKLMDPKTCPGYTAQLPVVLEVARAWGWWEKSQLALRYPDATAELMDLVELFNGQVHAARAWYIEERQREKKR